MVVLLALGTLLLVLAIRWAIRYKGRYETAAEANVLLSGTLNLIPDGTFLHKSFTWIRLHENGDLGIGIHPILTGLTGKPDSIDLPECGAEIEKGEKLMTIRKGKFSLQIRAPAGGTIIRCNEGLGSDPVAHQFSRDWLVLMKANDVSEEIPEWYVAERALEWTREKYQNIKEFVLGLSPQTSLGSTMADGGDLPQGILNQLEETDWKKFENEFLLK